MNIKIPFESIVKFKTNVCEITKMSLEHEYTINDDLVLGNFLVSGEYKCHEISINKDEFNFTLPFQVELNKNINTESIEFDIEDFTYELLENDNMKINILYRVRGNVEENIFERVDDNSLEDELNMVNFTEIDEEEVTNIKDIMIDEEVKEIEIELDNDDTSLNNEESEEDMITEEVRKIDESTKQDILNSIKMEEDSYVTYHVHIVKEGETIESICKMYTINTSIINEYNNITEINVGDKILIPFDNE